MASPTTPMHGKLCALWRQRPNGFNGAGLNDLSWGAGYDGVASGYFEVEIDGVGTPDTFRWRKNGGAWTEDVAITGAAQTLSDSQTVTFAATTGHTAGDKWAIGNLAGEACTESGAEAQITDATKRILNPNSPPAFTDSGAKNVLRIDWTRGAALFDGNVTAVTVGGNNGYIPDSAMLEKMGYLMNWELNLSVEEAVIRRAGQNWEEAVAGWGGGEGRAGAYFLGEKSFIAELARAAAGTQAYTLLELFNYDPDQDMTGDHIIAWAQITGISPNAPANALVEEGARFKLHGGPSFVANV